MVEEGSATARGGHPLGFFQNRPANATLANRTAGYEAASELYLEDPGLFKHTLILMFAGEGNPSVGKRCEPACCLERWSRKSDASVSMKFLWRLRMKLLGDPNPSTEEVGNVADRRWRPGEQRR
jgi:hypothetical protein